MGNFLFIKIRYSKRTFVYHSRPERLDTHHRDHNHEREAKADIKDPVVLAGKGSEKTTLIFSLKVKKYYILLQRSMSNVLVSLSST